MALANVNKLNKTLDSLATVLFSLDSCTFFHCNRVEALAVSIGKRLSLTSEELTLLKWGALLHDIGKQDIPSEILNKPIPLTATEWEQIQAHPVHGYRYAESIGVDKRVSQIILHHHLWANGEGGYPLTEKCRPCLLTQITTIADVVDAMTSERPYRPALSTADCFDHLEAYANTRYNQDIINVVKQIFSRK